MKAITQKSNSSLSTLKTNLKYNIYWAAFFTAANSIWILFSLNKGELLSILLLSFVINVLYLIVTVIYYKKIQLNISADAGVTQAIQLNYKIISNTLMFQKNWGMFATPISLITGSLIVNYYFGHTVSDYFNNTHKLTSLLICLIVLVPLAVIMGSKMTQKAFGGHLDQLQKYMIQLETLEDKDTLPA
ncbi:hypothetical protein [Mucilaginibacter antarcticus]|uniref:Uncharacterized protein n=1 Tax=Mucilaginibacter antarcticus TaxID=1855725 RepID=A0ABW5XR60_9SPHI